MRAQTCSRTLCDVSRISRACAARIYREEAFAGVPGTAGLGVVRSSRLRAARVGAGAATVERWGPARAQAAVEAASLFARIAASRARWRLAPPSSAASSCARLYSQCTSASHVKPMPPCAWIALGGHLATGVGRGRLGHRGGLGEALGVGVGGPCGERRRRARLLGVEQHLRAAVRDGLVGADGHAELLALLDVVRRSSPARGRTRRRALS